MHALGVATVEDAERLVQASQLSHIKVGLSDVDGVMLGKYLRRDKFLGALRSGLAFCDVVFGWDLDDQLYDNTKYTGWHTAYPDAKLRIIPQSGRRLPLEQGPSGEDMLLFLAEFEGDAGAICPRRLLHRTLDRAAGMGYDVYAALEYEFFMFRETPHSVRAKNYRNMENWTPGNFGYSVLRSTVEGDFYRKLLDMCERMDMPIEGLHTETGPGVLEAALAVDLAAAAADKAFLFKTFTKALAQQNGLMATFMAKWSHDHPGQSGHIHLSLRDRKTNRSAFYDESQPHGMSAIQASFMAGVQRYLPEFMAMYAQTINSYSRLVPGYWAPLDATWGMENRTTALRLIPGSDKSQRVEVRIGSADANPYLALSAALASGLYGIEQGLAPEPMVQGNAYTQQFPAHLRLPNTLWESAQRLRESEAARHLFGDAFVEHFAATREWEERQFRRHVTDWELARYFEII
ncbi:glutamine synthetase [Achromobacter insolitus]|uniref:glutamine synthetase family protein n=1 Tax=Achromobacter insolitus TaxID=217204 RepID=UPI0007C6FBDF|nr:glutamine synthetase [Achromobacter insolitus]OAE56464.1 glutamine synthetase [Achromobacter insolitus]OCZ54457.1 glutamine synthetase [Achromobacter insolitus]